MHHDLGFYHQGLFVNSGNFEVGILKHSINRANCEAISFGFVYERMIHAEVMTHRWSRNYSSSRAIPYDSPKPDVFTMKKWIQQDPALPLHFGANKPGMQSGGLIADPNGARAALLDLLDNIFTATDAIVGRYDLHKEIVNRYSEPFGWIRGIATMGRAQLMNFFSLRCTKFAHPNIQRLAVQMARLYRKSVATPLTEGQWHTPYFNDYIPEGSIIKMSDGTPGFSTLELVKPLIWSTARSAWTSYNNPTKDADFDKATKRHNDCVDLKHATPLEHQLRARSDNLTRGGLVPGYDSYRSMIPGEAASEFDFGILDDPGGYLNRDYMVP
jgi:hypothetical protein